jgi:hypothetical protein
VLDLRRRQLLAAWPRIRLCFRRRGDLNVGASPTPLGRRNYDDQPHSSIMFSARTQLQVANTRPGNGAAAHPRIAPAEIIPEVLGGAAPL